MMGVPRVRGVFVTAPLAAAAATAAGEMRRRPTVVGLDFTQSALDALRAGGVAALLYSGEERQARVALTALSEALTARRTRGHVDVRQELVLRSNLENYLT
jgi:ABC-type sugar transport system substrate-binding protein